jgi:hypothetical protein
VPLLPSSVTEPAWVEFSALIGVSERPEFSPDHPWGCHRRRTPDRIVFEHVLAALVHGSGYERIASPGCSDRTIRRRLCDWAERGVGEALLRATLDGYDRMVGLDLDDLAVDGSITKAPCGGEVAGRNPVDRGKQGTKRSVATDGDGIPLHLIAARANDHDSPLLEPTLAGICAMIGPLPGHRDIHGDQVFPALHLDRGYDSAKTRDLLEILGFHGEIATKGVPAPIQVGKRWPVERTHGWMNGFGKLRRLTDKLKIIAEFYLNLAAALTVIRRMINRARTQYRWPTRPTTRRLH